MIGVRCAEESQLQPEAAYRAARASPDGVPAGPVSQADNLGDLLPRRYCVQHGGSLEGELSQRATRGDPCGSARGGGGLGGKNRCLLTSGNCGGTRLSDRCYRGLMEELGLFELSFLASKSSEH